MKKIYCFLVFLSLGLHAGFAQKLRTNVCVYGNTTAALAAGIQSARSGVQTLLISDSNSWIEPASLGDWEKLNPASALGVEFLKKYTTLEIHKELKADSLLQSIEALVDTVKNLKRINASTIEKIKESGKGWELSLKSGQKIKTLILVDGDKNQVVLKQLGLRPQAGAAIAFDVNNPLTRTSVAILGTNHILPLQALVVDKQANIISIPTTGTVLAQLNAGQAAGATAAYCAFFKTTTEHLNVRAIQSELLTYKATLLPFGDVHQADSNFIAVEHVALTGLLASGIRQKGDTSLWMGNQSLNANELKTPMKKLYSRSQIWFADHANIGDLTIGEAIGLITYTATRGKELKAEIESGWKSTLKLSGTFDEKRKISRSEFSVLLEAYLQPFATQVDLQGELIN
ncbi:MAG: hypothetical protein ACKOWL_05175 [Sphingobacteriaceae bacterium]